MQWYEILISVLTLLAIPSLIGILWKDLHVKNKERREHNGDLKNKEQEESLRKIIREETETLNSKVDALNQNFDIIKEGVVCTLRNDILTAYHECCRKGYRDERDYSNIQHLYECYKGLGGNSFVDGLMEEFKELPNEDQYKKDKKEEYKKEYKVEI